jgi:hypothetical protein
LHSCTFHENRGDNGGSGVSSFNAFGVNSNISLDHSIIAFSEIGAAAAVGTGAVVSLSCVDIFGNQAGDWTGAIENQQNINGNFSQDPLFCDRLQSNFTLDANSPCAPPGSTGCGLVGAEDVGCGGAVSADEGTELSTWGKIKGLYR